MPRRKNWRTAEAKRGVKNPKKQRLTDLTGDTGPLNSTKFDLDMGDTDTLNNSNSNNMGDTDLLSNANNNERQRECATKKEARKNKDFKKENLLLKEKLERMKIIKGLKHKIERQKELVAKREARKNKDFNKRELAAKREVRKDKNYRRAEAESKKSQRDNSDLRQIEKRQKNLLLKERLERMKISKENLLLKRESRKNDDFKRNETEKKKIARQDEDYRKHESERDFHRKQEYRSHPENLENERLKKQSSRQKNLDIDRCYDKTVKSAKRKNIDFTDHEKDLKKRIQVQPTINSLPHTLEKSGTISVKLKKSWNSKKCDFSENVRPFAVICALHYLMRTSDLYKSSGIEINEDWITEIAK
ncbi:unnamed protein product [Mytilus coruscus]|uniref:Uncharacterized protein n=1 Tax=Mytilus coruscus TaxID=42192 RepID=A0A6J8E9D4_MYTCO|nr:unnamed protein product [Mytilus coruscus]